MGLSRSDLARDRKTITYTHVHGPGDESVVTVTYRPSALTADEIDAMEERTGDEMHRFCCELLALVLIEWDVYEDDEQTVRTPTTVESLRTFPQSFLWGIVGAIRDANRPGGGGPSGAG